MCEQKYMKGIDKQTIPQRLFNTPVSVVDRTTRTKKHMQSKYELLYLN